MVRERSVEDGRMWGRVQAKCKITTDGSGERPGWLLSRWHRVPPAVRYDMIFHAICGEHDLISVLVSIREPLTMATSYHGSLGQRNAICPTPSVHSPLPPAGRQISILRVQHRPRARDHARLMDEGFWLRTTLKQLCVPP